MPSPRRKAWRKQNVPGELVRMFFSVSDLNFSEQNILRLELIFSVMGRITLQGTPTAMTPAGMSWVTTLPAPITEPAPMVTPPQTVEFAPIQTFSSSVIGAEVPMPWLRCSGSMA